MDMIKIVHDVSPKTDVFDMWIESKSDLKNTVNRVAAGFLVFEDGLSPSQNQAISLFV